MKSLICGLTLLLCSNLSAQSNFPEAWQGHWKGELNWYPLGVREPRKVNMELKIQPQDSAWSWQIIYGAASEVNRPYRLLPRDTAKGHWVIDENNGILLDQFWIGGHLTGAFTVQNATILSHYWLKADTLHVEFFNISAKPASTTGHGTEASPKVDSYQTKSYQHAVLTRIDQ